MWGKDLMNIRKKIISLFLTIVMSLTTLYIMPAHESKAADTYITLEDFAEYLSKEIDLDAADGNEESRYVNRLIEAGIVKKGEFTSYKSYLTRGDAMVLLNRADEYLYGDTLDTELVQLVIDKRISDISKVKESKKDDVAKAYLKGYVTGYSNGQYTTDRTMKVKNKITKAGVLNCLKMLKNKSLRAKISPDGQLIRTTKLPVYAKYYPYILASFPNTYYDWKFQFEGQSSYEPATGIRTPYENIKGYAFPVDVDKTQKFEDFITVKAEYLDIWISKVKTYMENVFSVDYRTIDETWVETVLATDYSCGIERAKENTRKEIEQYVANMKDNKTIVEFSKIAVDGSSLYFFNGQYYLRTYVKYRIVSSNILYGVDTDTLIAERPYNNILYTRFPLVDFTDYKLGEWREGHFDVELSRYTEQDGGNLGIFYAFLNEYYYYEGRAVGDADIWKK
jgi:hypothetical protein